ncbi:folylpolyglutamate synthase [Trichomonascus vanleenenianus]|uniref:tetrahydrofolate synthase n=1 Tax=Trichomonascus vanleenenianus TaxID=2268995 RepID=UPI003ECA1E3B
MSTVKPRTYKDAIEALNSLQTNFAVIQAIRAAGVKANDQAIPQMLEWARRAGYDPREFNKLNPLHVTGTKGKGSTCAFIQSILTQYQVPQGPIHKIGLYTSPHLKSVRERIRINGQPISEEKFTKYFFELWDRLESTKSDLNLFPEHTEGVKPGYFRYLTLLSFHVFLSEGVDTAIYEVGIGGEYDSTNIIVKPTVAGVTSLGIDHVNVLGNTIESIAWNKGGIYKPGAPALTVRQPEAAMEVLRERAKEKGTELQVVDVYPQIIDIKLGLPATFQGINASLAARMCIEHLRHFGVEVAEDRLPLEFVKGLEQATWPGRCQTIEDGNIHWHLDGAHTRESIEVAAQWFCEKAHERKAHNRVLFFNQQTRDINVLIESLRAIIVDNNIEFDHVVFTTNVTWSSGKYSADLASFNNSKEEVDSLKVQKELAALWQKLDGRAESRVFGNIEDSVNYVRSLEGTSDVFVTGSLHLVGGFLTVLEGED